MVKKEESQPGNRIYLLLIGCPFQCCVLLFQILFVAFLSTYEFLLLRQVEFFKQLGANNDACESVVLKESFLQAIDSCNSFLAADSHVLSCPPFIP